MSDGMAWSRIVGGGVAGGLLPAVLVVGTTLAFDALGGSADDVATFSVGAGWILGLGGGAVLTFLFGLWAARRTGRRPGLHGLCVGVVSFASDLALVATLAASFTVPMVLALAVRPPAGFMGGWWAGRRTASGWSPNEAE